MSLFGTGCGGWAWIVNEADAMKRSTIRQLLVLLERLPPHVAVIFTTTRDRDDWLASDADARALLSRCVDVRLTIEGLAKPFAARALKIAQLEGLDGCPEATYLAKIKVFRNNFRQLLQAIDAGEMTKT